MNSTIMTCLEFVHIPKTGGTSVEAAACSSNVSWGSCHYSIPNHCEGCLFDEPPCTPKMGYGPIWHIPPLWHTKKCGIKNYNHCETFTVVRNPISRARSFFGCQWWGPRIKKNINTWVRKNYRSWIPQHRFLPVTHVLHYETLSTDFDNLMKLKDLNISLSKTHQNPSRANNQEKLSEQVICELANFFQRDFEVFNYTMPANCI